MPYSCSCGQYVRYMSASGVIRLRLVQQYQNVPLDDPVSLVVYLQQYQMEREEVHARGRTV